MMTKNAPNESKNGTTVWDTQKIRAMIKEVAVLIVAEEAKNQPEKVDEDDAHKSPPYLLAILLIILAGFTSATIILTTRPDTDALIVITTVFVSVTTLTGTIFGMMQKNQILMETHEANVKSQLTLLQAKETHDIVNSKLDQWKSDFITAEIERGKVASSKARTEGRQEGREAANDRTDQLAKLKKEGE